jgi:hypothetical protein
MKNCIVLQTVNPHPILIDFLIHLYDYTFQKKLDYTIYVVVDNNKKQYKNTKKIKYIQIDPEEATKKGFKDSLLRYYHLPHKKIKSFALDKALYYFSNYNIYDNYWLIEEDVFIPSVKTIPMLDKKYKQADLLVSSNGIKEDYKPDWHWVLMVKNNKSKDRKTKVKKMLNAKKEDFYFSLPWYHSWCPVLRISNKLLEEINNFVKKHHTLLMNEFMFNTIAEKSNLKIVLVEEFKFRYVHKENKKTLFKKKEIKVKNLYSQIKDQETQKNYRKE